MQTSHSSLRLRIASTAFLLPLTLGCGGPQRDSQWPETQPVSGVVTFKSEPVSEATVTFVPSGGGKSATGVTDETGKYVLKTYFSASFQDEGAPAGNYNVTISKPIKASLPAPNTDGMERGEAQKLLAKHAAESREWAAKFKGKKSELPDNYTVVETSGLTANVAEGENSFNFDLVE